MKHFDDLLTEDIEQYEGRHDDLIYQAPAFYRLLVNTLDDPRLPRRLRGIILAAIAYFVLPVDVIPEEIEGPYGYIDDIFFCAWVGKKLAEKLGTDFLIENWDGESPVMPLIEDILSREPELLGNRFHEILTYVGLSN
jgi:uncharacterized membrane protein YkvA (DUF1232 family)